MITVVIKGTVTDFNKYSDAERKHRQVAAAIKKDETERVWVECLDQKIPHIDTYPLHVHFDWYMPDRTIDPDNIAFAKKFILDGMQTAKVLDNDGWKQLSGGFSDSFHIDKENPRVEVTFSVVE